MTMVPVLIRHGWELQVSNFPDKKRTALTLQHTNSAICYILGYFTSEKQVEMFNEFIGGELDIDSMERIWKK